VAREEEAGVERPVGMSEHEHEDPEREDDEVEAHAAATADEPADDDGNDFEAHLFQRR
jgi:hypothetical protein